MTELVETNHNIIETDSSLEKRLNLERYKTPNPYNYNNLELAQRRIEVDECKKRHPNVPAFYIEMVYDYIKNTPENLVNQNIIEDIWANSKTKNNIF